MSVCRRLCPHRDSSGREMNRDKATKNPGPEADRLKPISLDQLTPAEALSGALRVNPEDVKRLQRAEKARKGRKATKKAQARPQSIGMGFVKCRIPKRASGRRSRGGAFDAENARNFREGGRSL